MKNNSKHRPSIGIICLALMIAGLIAVIIYGGVELAGQQTTQSGTVLQDPGWRHYSGRVTGYNQYQASDGGTYVYQTGDVPLVVTSRGDVVAIPVGEHLPVGSVIRYSCKGANSNDSGDVTDPLGYDTPYLYWPGACFTDEFQITWNVKQ